MLVLVLSVGDRWVYCLWFLLLLLLVVSVSVSSCCFHFIVLSPLAEAVVAMVMALQLPEREVLFCIGVCRA